MDVVRNLVEGAVGGDGHLLERLVDGVRIVQDGVLQSVAADFTFLAELLQLAHAHVQLVGQVLCDLRRVLHDGGQFVAVHHALAERLRDLTHGRVRLLRGGSRGNHILRQEGAELDGSLVVGDGGWGERYESRGAFGQLLHGHADFVRAIQCLRQHVAPVRGVPDRVLNHRVRAAPSVADGDNLPADFADGAGQDAYGRAGRTQPEIRAETTRADVAAEPGGERAGAALAERLELAGDATQATLERAGDARLRGLAEIVVEQSGEHASRVGEQFAGRGGGHHLRCEYGSGARLHQRGL